MPKISKEFKEVIFALWVVIVIGLGFWDGYHERYAEGVFSFAVVALVFLMRIDLRQRERDREPNMVYNINLSGGQTVQDVADAITKTMNARDARR